MAKKISEQIESLQSENIRLYFLMEEMCMEGQRSAMYISFVVQTQAGVSLPGIPFL